MRKARIGILISGRGSNMQALVEAAKAADYPAEIALILSNNIDAAGLEFAADNGIPHQAINHRNFSSREEFDAALDQALREANVQIVCLAGFMRIVSKWFVDRWRDRLINIHPSLLPAFKGLHIHERVLEAGVKLTGCTVHYVRAEMDEGPVIAQAAVPVHERDDVDSLAARVLVAEHQLYPRALAFVAAGQTRVAQERVKLSEAEAPTGILINPVN